MITAGFSTLLIPVYLGMVPTNLLPILGRILWWIGQPGCELARLRDDAGRGQKPCRLQASGTLCLVALMTLGLQIAESFEPSAYGLSLQTQ